MDVGHLRTADALIDPAHDIAQNALRIVVELRPDLVRRPVPPGLGDRDGQQVTERRDRLGGTLALAGEDVDAVIVRRMQRRRGGRRDPGGIRPGLRMADLLVEHVRHPVRCRPHALADLRFARQAAGEADLHVAVFVGRDPAACLHLALRDHRAGVHRRVHLVAGTVQEAGVDEDQPVANGVDARGQVRAGPPLLVHQPDLDRVAIEPQQIFDRVEQRVGQRRFVRPVHLGLDDVDRSGAAVATLPPHVVQSDQAGNDRIEDAFGRFAAVWQAHGRCRHQMADVADEQQAAAGQSDRAAVGGGIGAILGQRPAHRPPALVEARLQVAAHQPQPIGIASDLVLGIDRRD